MQGRTKTLLACLAGLLLTVAMPLVQAQADKNTKAGFEKLRSLVGEWQATLPDGKLMRVSYAEINGGAIEERYRSKDPMWWNMSTVYHLDKNRIMMTHYCSWGNHPRMTAIVPDLPVKHLAFHFLDMTVTEPKNGYMHDVSFDFEDANHMSHHWIWHEKGEDRPLTLTLVRQQDVSSR